MSPMGSHPGCSCQEPLIHFLGVGTSPPVSQNTRGVQMSLMVSFHPLKNWVFIWAVPQSADQRSHPSSANSDRLSRGSSWGAGRDGGRVSGAPYPRLSLLCSQGTSNGTSGSTVGRNPTSASTASASLPTRGLCSATSASTPVRTRLLFSLRDFGEILGLSIPHIFSLQERSRVSA